ncbi:hypothetical protein EOM86_00620 [Candidatus Nomurabacteria bacterium]|nr:hypothetical protein [Candidatus Nomurabacteria bacterium]
MLLFALTLVSCQNPTLVPQKSEDSSHTESTAEDEGEKGMMSNITVRYPSNIFVEGETVKLYYVGKNETLEWSLIDWNDKTIDSGEWTDIEEPLVFDDIDFGYYRIEINPAKNPAKKTSIYFTYIRDVSEIPASSDVVYCLDTAQSIFGVSNKFIGDTAILSGTGMIRDRLSWPSIVFEGSDTDWKKFDETAQIYADSAVGIVNCMHLVPDEVKSPLLDIPYDLQALYEFTKEAASHFKDSYSAVEFWNEIDLVEFCRDPAWDYAAAQKAAYLGLKAGNPQLDVLVASITHNIGLNFTDIAFANDIGAHFDIYNFHIYTPTESYEKVFLDRIDLMNKYNISARPFWVTEFGMALQVAEGMGEPTVSGKPEHNPAQDILQAEYLVKGNIVLQSLGSSKNFFFILPPWNSTENKVHGLFRQNLTVKPGYTAQTVLVSMLGGKEYIGRLTTEEGIECYLYESDNGEKTLVLWGEGTLDLGSENAGVKIYDMVGGQTAGTGDGRIEATVSPQYVVGVKDITAVSTNLMGQLTAKENRTIDKDIVIRAVLGSSFGVLNRVSAKSKTGKTAEFKIDVFNFSSIEKEVELKDLSETCIVSFDIKKVTIPAMGKIQIDAQVTINEKGPMKIGGSTSSGEVTQIYIPLIG